MTGRGKVARAERRDAEMSADLADDFAAAAVHWRNASRHRDAADRARRNGQPEAERAAREAADREERMAMMLEGRGVE